MKLLKASKFNCDFKGVARDNHEGLPNTNEFNHDESVITAFSCEDAIFQYLREMWDISLSVSIPSNLGNESLSYGETYEDFISSNAVEFNMTKLDENHITMEIKYKGRDEFFYKITALKSL